MAFRPWVLAECPWPHVRDTRWQGAILPWGATEAHNTHLPYGTDTYQCDALAAAAAGAAWERGARLAVLPTVPFGVNTPQLDIPLTCNMSPSTQLAVLGDLVQALEGQGIDRLLLFNGHGGNDFKPLIRELVPRTRVLVCTLDWWQFVPAAPYFEEPGDHAGELETSVMQHIAPALVRDLAEAGDGAARRPRITAMRDGRVWTPRPWTRVTRDTGIGDPRAASAAKGARYVAAVTAAIADFLVEFAHADLATLYEGA
ncbi:MAG: creatininase family protein [Gemmatimonadaceae bacterium]|nr:creatininase family protein [Gemmatimonadaceae bacterium]